VTTLPHELNDLVFTNQKLMHSLFFRCVNEVLTRIASQTYGCKIGTVQVLHTWGQRLGLHYHIHVVMTAGGVSFDGTRWIPISASDAAMQPSNIAAMFRETYLRRVTSMLKRGVIQCKNADEMAATLKKIAKKNWVVNVQPPPPHCHGADAVIHYLSSYVIGGPISDRRIVDDDGTYVTIRFKNYATEQIEFEKMLGTEFATRFSLHILPPFMQRVRYTSLFQPAGRMPRLKHAQELIIAGGFSCCRTPPPGSTADGGESILLGEEYDEDEWVEASEPIDEKPNGTLTCVECAGRMRTSRDEWLLPRATVNLLRVVKVLLLLIRRDGESILMQIQRLLIHHPIMTRRYHSAYEIELLESMLLECVVDPRALLRRMLGLNHPLVIAARDRGPPDEEQGQADA
jgi:hypothetical protein